MGTLHRGDYIDLGDHRLFILRRLGAKVQKGYTRFWVHEPYEEVAKGGPYYVVQSYWPDTAKSNIGVISGKTVEKYNVPIITRSRVIETPSLESNLTLDDARLLLGKARDYRS